MLAYSGGTASLQDGLHEGAMHEDDHEDEWMATQLQKGLGRSGTHMTPHAMPQQARVALKAGSSGGGGVDVIEQQAADAME